MISFMEMTTLLEHFDLANLNFCKQYHFTMKKWNYSMPLDNKIMHML